MTAETLLKLAERCEWMDGADLRLDSEIDVAVGRAVDPDPRFPPHYTACLDVARTLVPEGAQFGCGSKDATGRAWAWVGQKGGPMNSGEEIGAGTTPALALTAAALRARGRLVGDDR